MTQPLPTALDQLLLKPIASGGTPAPMRRFLNFTSGVSLSDNPNFVDPTTGEIVGAIDAAVAAGVDGEGATPVVNGLNSNVAVTGAVAVRLTGPTAPFALGGFALTASSPGGGQRLTLVNTTAQTMTLVNEDASSTAANRLRIGAGVSSLLPPNAQAAFVYDTTTARWILQNGGVTYRTVFDVREWGAAGGNATADTAAALAAAAAISANGGGTLHYAGGYSFLHSTNIDLPSNAIVHVDGTVTQTVALKHLFTATGQSNIKIHGNGKLRGVGGAAFLSTEHAIFLTNCSNFSIESGLDIASFAGHSICLYGCTDFTVGAVATSGCAGGYRMRGCARGVWTGAALRAPSTPNNYFIGGFFCDSTDGNAYPPCYDLRFVGCLVADFVDAQCFELHAGSRIAYVGCIVENGNIGFSCNPYSPGATGYCQTTASFVQPAVGSSVTVPVTSTAGLTLNQYLLIGGGGFYQATAIGSGTVTFTLQADETNATTGATVATDAAILPGDITRDVVYAGCVYNGQTLSGAYSDLVQVGINIGGDPLNLVRRVSISGCAISNGGYGGTDIAGAGLHMNYAQGVTLSGGTFDQCWGSAIFIDKGTTDFEASGFNVSNVQPLTIDGDTFQCGVLVGFSGVTGHVHHWTVDGCDYAMRAFDFGDAIADVVAPGFAIDDFEVKNASLGRVGAPSACVVDGVLTKIAGATTVAVTPWVKVVNCDDSSTCVVTQPMNGAYHGQILTYRDQSGNTGIDRSHSTLENSQVWTGAVPSNLGGSVTVAVTLGSAAVTFSVDAGTHVLAAGQAFIFSTEPRKVYYLSAGVTLSASVPTAAVLTSASSGPTNGGAGLIAQQLGTGFITLMFLSDVNLASELRRGCSG